MKPHVEIYVKALKYTIADFVPCEICKRTAVEVHHIHRRGKNNEWYAHRIENLQGICRKCHTAYGDLKQFKSMLYRIHKAFMIANNVDFDKDWIDGQIEKYKPYEDEVKEKQIKNKI